jgi:hypothetical protein
MKTDMNAKPFLGVAILAVVCIASTAAMAQDPGGRGIYDEELRVRLDRQMDLSREMGLDAGGWFNVAYFNYDEIGGSHRQLVRYSARGWISFNAQGVHRAYFRGLLQYDQWVSGGNPSSDRGNDFDEKIERAWYEFNLGQLMTNANGEAPVVGFKVRVGRQFMTIGTALALSIPMDAVRFDIDHKYFHVMAFLGNNDRLSLNIDDSNLVANQQDRNFFGAQITGKFGQHRPFAYFLMQNDHSTPKPRDPNQKYEYNSRYVGLGSTGPLFVPNLQYSTEIVGEFGTTYAAGSTTREDNICAMAFDAQLIYTFADTPTRPRVMVEYLYGSGDSDRTMSSTATVGGTPPGQRDRAFNGFGFRDTGIAFSPEISNIHVYILGGSFFPLENTRFFENMEIGSKVFFYQKDQGSGPISEPTTGADSAWLGWEWDVYCNWRITSDLTFTTRYGAFFPGGSYNGGDKSPQHFFYTGITISF